MHKDHLIKITSNPVSFSLLVYKGNDFSTHPLGCCCHHEVLSNKRGFGLNHDYFKNWMGPNFGKSCWCSHTQQVTRQQPIIRSVTLYVSLLKWRMKLLMISGNNHNQNHGEFNITKISLFCYFKYQSVTDLVSFLIKRIY